MSNQVSVQQAAVVSKEEMVMRLARHLEQQPESTRASHRLMKRLEVASLALPAAAVVAAVVVIAHSASLPAGASAAALFAIPATFGLYLFLVGLHSALVQAIPPVDYLLWQVATTTRGFSGFATGSAAVGLGVFLMLAAVVDAVLWGMGVYAFLNPDILEVLIPCIIVSSVALGLLGTWGRKRLS
jgi:hypothetical protein